MTTSPPAFARPRPGTQPPYLYPDYASTVKRAPKRKHGGMGGWLEAVYGRGEGVIECDAFSGDLVVRKK